MDYITFEHVLKKLFNQFDITAPSSKRQGLHVVWELSLDIVVSKESIIAISDQRRYIKKIFGAICPLLQGITVASSGSGTSTQDPVGQIRTKLLQSANTVFSPIVSRFNYSMKGLLIGDEHFRHCLYTMASNGQDTTSNTGRWVTNEMKDPASKNVTWKRPANCGGAE